MKKYIILLIISLIFVSPVFAQKINTDDLDFRKMKFSETENPVAYKYLVDYTDMLRSKINFKLIRPFYGVHYYFKICSNGTIIDLKPAPLNYPYNGKKVDKYFQELLKNNPPPPYPENMEIGDVKVELYIDLDNESKTKIKSYRNDEGAFYPGNHFDIQMYEKSIKAIIWGTLFY